MDFSETLEELVKRLASYERRKKILKAELKHLEEQEIPEVKSLISQSLSANSLESARLKIGTVSKKRTVSLRAQDTELICKLMLKGFLEAHKEGRPLADSLLYQRTAHQGNFWERIRESLGITDDKEEIPLEILEEEAKKFGLYVQVTNDVTFKRSGNE